MPTFSKADLPFLLSGRGTLDADLGPVAPTTPLPRDMAPLRLRVAGDGTQPLVLGLPGTVKVALTASATASLTAVFPDGPRLDVLARHDLEGFFADPAHAGHVVLAFEAGASAETGVRAAFSHALLTAAVSVDAGADGGFGYCRAFEASRPASDVLTALFAVMRLPEQFDRAPEPGEAAVLRYGGTLRLGTEAAVGYALGGTHAFGIGDLALSERYGLSILGKIGLTATVAGRFAISISGPPDEPGWARVRVTRQRAADLGVAADVKVTADTRLDGLPGDAHEFLGAVLGVNGKSIVTLLQRVRTHADAASLSGAIDGLARQYLGELMDVGFDALEANAAFTRLLARAERIVTSAARVEDRAVTLFDRYVDRLDELTAFLEELSDLQADGLARLRGRLSPRTWAMLAQLTDGDPLGFLLGRVVHDGQERDALPLLQARAREVLDLIRSDAHQELRDAITLARRRFGIDVLLREAARLDSPAELRAVATERVGAFVTRLVGRTLASSGDVDAAYQRLAAVRNDLEAFTTRLYDRFRDAAAASLTTALHAEYARATEREALVDVTIATTSAAGLQLMRAACRGDFSEVLATTDAALVRLRGGALTHRTRRTSGFAVTIAGWHRNYAYDGIDRVITESEQRLVSSDRGLLVLGTTTLEVGRQRRRQDETLHANLLVRALGQAAGVIPDDGRTLAWLLDAVSSLTARYALAFSDAHTTVDELEDYLAFARDVGLAEAGATLDALQPVLPRDAAGRFGRIEATYEVRFDPPALARLLAVRTWTGAAEARVRLAMRRLVLANYRRNAMLEDVALAYATPGVFAIHQAEGSARFLNVSPRSFDVAPVTGVHAPPRVVLAKHELELLKTLYAIEQSMVEALRTLVSVLHGEPRVSAVAFEREVRGFGETLQLFDRFDQASGARGVGTTTLFAMLAALLDTGTGAPPPYAAALRLRSEVDGRVVEQLFLSPAAAAG